MSLQFPDKPQYQTGLNEAGFGAEIVLGHCSSDGMQLEGNSLFIPLMTVKECDQCTKGNTPSIEHPLVGFYGDTTTEFCKTPWKWKLFESAIRQMINELFETDEIKRLPGILVSPQNAYHSSNIVSPLTVGKIARWTHLLDTCFNSVSQVQHHAKADRDADVGGKPFVKEAMLQCASALLHDAAVYVFSHTGENAMRERGIPADHDAVLLLLTIRLAKAGVFERLGLTTEEVMGAVFPPHLAELFLDAKSDGDLELLKTSLTYWKEAVQGITDEDIDSIVSLHNNSGLIRAVERYGGIARYVHNCLDNISYIPTDQGHQSQAEMHALLGCERGKYFLSPNHRPLTKEDYDFLSGEMTERMSKPNRNYFYDSKEIQIGTETRTVQYIVERRRDGSFSEDGFDIPIYVKEKDWIPVKVGKTLLAKEECLRSTWASKNGEYDVVTSSVHGFYRIIKGHFDYARRMVSSLGAAVSVGFWEQVLSEAEFNPLDFLRLDDTGFIERYFPEKKRRLLLGSGPEKPVGYDADIVRLISLKPKNKVDWFKERLDRNSVRRIVGKLNLEINEWKKRHSVPETSDCYAASASTIHKEFGIQVVGMEEGTAFDFLKDKDRPPLERNGSTVYLKRLLRPADTFSSRLVIEEKSFEGIHEPEFDFILEELIVGSMTVCIDKNLKVGKQRNESRATNLAIADLKKSLLTILKDAEVTVILADDEAVKRPLLEYYFLSVNSSQRR